MKLTNQAYENLNNQTKHCLDQSGENYQRRRSGWDNKSLIYVSTAEENMS